MSGIVSCLSFEQFVVSLDCDSIIQDKKQECKTFLKILIFFYLLAIINQTVTFNLCKTNNKLSFLQELQKIIFDHHDKCCPRGRMTLSL